MARLNNDIEKYIKGELTPAEMHALEQKALQDPFLAEALEGVEHIDAEHFSDDIASLQESIREKSRKSRGLAKTITLNGFPMYAGIAAGLLLLAISTYVIFISIKPKHNNEIAAEQSAPEHTGSQKSNDISDSLLALNNVKDKEITEKKTEKPRPETRRQSPAIAQKDEGTPSIAPSESEVVAEEAIEETPVPEVVQEKPAEQIIKEKADADVNDEKRLPSQHAIAAIETDEVEPLRKSKMASESAPQLRSALEPTIVQGKVTAEGEPLPGANVIIKGTTIGTVTDIDGNFEIPVQDAGQKLVVNFIGYQSKEIETAGHQDVNVELTPDMTSLNEVVVVGYGEGSTSEPVFTIAEPVGGFNAFKKYLNEQLEYPKEALENKIEGYVTIQFFVEANGELTNFKVVRSLGYGCDEEVMRLIRQGPQWKASIQDNKPTREKVRVRQKFQLPKNKE